MRDEWLLEYEWDDDTIMISNHTSTIPLQYYNYRGVIRNMIHELMNIQKCRGLGGVTLGHCQGYLQNYWRYTDTTKHPNFRLVTQLDQRWSDGDFQQSHPIDSLNRLVVSVWSLLSSIIMHWIDRIVLSFYGWLEIWTHLVQACAHHLLDVLLQW